MVGYSPSSKVQAGQSKYMKQQGPNREGGHWWLAIVQVERSKQGSPST